MSPGQSARNGSSVEPGLPNTFLMPKARSRPKVASLTLTDLLVVLAGLRDDIGRLPGRVCWRFRHCEEETTEQPTCRWIGSRSQAVCLHEQAHQIGFMRLQPTTRWPMLP